MRCKKEVLASLVWILNPPRYVGARYFWHKETYINVHIQLTLRKITDKVNRYLYPNLTAFVEDMTLV